MYKTSIILLFVLYWLYAIVNGLEIKLPHNKYTSIATLLFLPKSYKMFIGPAKTHLSVDYTFYNGTQIIQNINTDNFFVTSLRKDFPFSNKTFKINKGIENAFFYVDIQYQTKFIELYKKKIDRKTIDKQLEKMLSTDKEIKKCIKTINNLYKIIIENNHNLKEATRVKVQFKREPIRLDYKDPMAYVDYNETYLIGKLILHEQTINIK